MDVIIENVMVNRTIKVFVETVDGDERINYYQENGVTKEQRVKLNVCLPSEEYKPFLHADSRIVKAIFETASKEYFGDEFIKVDDYKKAELKFKEELAKKDDELEKTKDRFDKVFEAYMALATNSLNGTVLMAEFVE